MIPNEAELAPTKFNNEHMAALITTLSGEILATKLTTKIEKNTICVIDEKGKTVGELTKRGTFGWWTACVVDGDRRNFVGSEPDAFKMCESFFARLIRMKIEMWMEYHYLCQA